MNSPVDKFIELLEAIVEAKINDMKSDDVADSVKLARCRDELRTFCNNGIVDQKEDQKTE